jgi:hypothetical protein
MNMPKDPIVEELHRMREEQAARFGNDLHAICEDARRRQGQDGRRVVPASPRPAVAEAIDEAAA